MYLQTLKLADIHPYANNPRINKKAIEPVMKSIKKDGYRARIIVDKDGVIIAGHTRYEAIRRLGWKKVEVWVADDMTPEQIADYRIRDNLTADIAEWDFSALEIEIKDLDLDFDMSEFDGFNLESEDNEKENSKSKQDDKYSAETKIPQYEPKGNQPEVKSLIDTSRLDKLLDEINKSNVSKAEKHFLEVAAYRHAVIDFDKVADYYAGASAEMQSLMEHNALVIIDINDAIANGFVQLSSKLDKIIARDME